MAAEAAPAAPPAEALELFRALADETRVAIIRVLALTDLRVGELVERLAAPQNVLSYHLKQLRALRLLRERRSSADGREIYYSLDWEWLQALYLAAGQALLLGSAQGSAQTARSAGLPPLRVLFLCTENSARSQLAEALLRDLGGDRVRVASAGSVPAAVVHPDVVALLAESGIDTTSLAPKALARFADQSFDYVITVCDRMRENCPVWAAEPRQIHWSIPDPSAIPDPVARRQAFQAVQQELLSRMRYLLSLPQPAAGEPIRPAAGASRRAGRAGVG